MESSRSPWDISHMAARPDKKEDAERSARAIIEKLDAMGLPTGIESERQWTIQAGVSSSFFSNLRKSPSDPTINNLRLILQTAGSSLPEFFLDEAGGRVVRAPSKQAIEKAVAEALDDLPARRGPRAEYLVSVFGQLLELPKSRSAKPVAKRSPAKGALSAAAPPRRATKRA